MWDALPTWRSVRRQTESLASRAYKQFTSVFPLPPSPKFLRNHSTTIVWAFVGLVALAYLAGGWGKRRLGLQSVPVAGFELTGTLGGGAPRRNARFEQIVSEGPEGIKTIEQLMRVSARKFAQRRCFGTRRFISSEVKEVHGKKVMTAKLGDYQWASFAEVYERVLNFGSGLHAAGVRRGDVVAMYANTCAEWQIAAHGTFAIGGCITTVYANLGEDALVFALNKTEARVLVTQSLTLDSVERVVAKIPSLRVVVVAHGGAHGPEVDVRARAKAEVWQSRKGLRLVAFDDVEEDGDRKRVSTEAPSPEDVAVIMYTSGSTGTPKGVVLTHRSLLAAMHGLALLIPGLERGLDVYMAYLPLAHVLELAAENALLMHGACLGFGSPFTLTDGAPGLERGCRGDALVLRPTLLAGVPKIFDTIRNRVLAKVNKAGGLTAKIFNWALETKMRYQDQGRSTPLLDALIFKPKGASAVGGRLRLVLSGGGPLSGDTQRFIKAVLCVKMGQGYGLTETCAACTVTNFDDPSVERVGPPVPCAMVKLIDWPEGNYSINDRPHPRGEVAISGAVLAREYFHNPSETTKAFVTDEQGRRWFLTGDIGEWQADGVLKIVGRKKGIVKLSHGEYLALEKVDSMVATGPFVANACAHADSGADACVVIVSPERHAFLDWLRAAVPDADASAPLATLCADGRVVAAATKAIQALCREAGASRSEVPAGVLLVPDEWTPDTHLVTAALKIRRQKIVDHYRERLEAMGK